MLSFQLLTEKDRREAAALEKRRALEEERKKRIFNPRNRIIGVSQTFPFHICFGNKYFLLHQKSTSSQKRK